MKILTCVRAISLASATLSLVSCATSPVATNPETPPTDSKTAIVAVKKDGKLQLAGDQYKFVKAMQRAFEKVKEKEFVRDAHISAVGKKNFLAVNLEDVKQARSTLFIELIPVGESSAFHTVGPHVVTCVNQNNCPNNDCILYASGTITNPTPFTHCECRGDPIGTQNHRCNFKINKLYIGDLIAVFKDNVRSL